MPQLKEAGWLAAALGGVLLISSGAFLLGSRVRSRDLKKLEEEERSRRRLNRLRHAKGNFPPPFLNGWHFVAESREVVKQAPPLTVQAFGEELVLFRDGNGKVGALHAFCPHLGTHLGGGHVDGNCLRCPYHSWSFDIEGIVRDVPYCPPEKLKGVLNKNNSVRSYPVREIGCLIFVWYDAAGNDPWYELSMLDEIKDSEKFYYAGSSPVEDWHMHLMEPSQNTTDSYHFLTTHQWFGQLPDPNRRTGWVYIEYETAVRTAVLKHKDHDGSEISPETIIIDEDVKSASLFGKWSFPLCFINHTRGHARFQGPQVVRYRLENDLFGTIIVVQVWTPKEPFRQASRIFVWAAKPWPRFLARGLMLGVKQTVEQDRDVWNHKIHCRPAKLVVGDPPFQAYNTWLTQFYNEDSVQWGDPRLLMD
mmetsp:Transcript_1020/g.2201  ORF Transcript_1020/g.2201 Transcript_1020/m.2201 type:complete len:420 (+) Transcript_1020:123-1382(+)